MRLTGCKLRRCSSSAHTSTTAAGWPAALRLRSAPVFSSAPAQQDHSEYESDGGDDGAFPSGAGTPNPVVELPLVLAARLCMAFVHALLRIAILTIYLKYNCNN